MIKKISTLLFVLILTTNSLACFGPELIIGYEEGNLRSFYIASILELFIQEKTGISSTLIPLNNKSLSKIQEEKVDVVVYPIKDTKMLTKQNLTIEGQYFYYYRTKIREDLRFALLEETFKKLASKLTKKELEELFKIVEKRGKIKKTIKEFLIERAIL